jgi:hypothetical protein
MFGQKTEYTTPVAKVRITRVYDGYDVEFKAKKWHLGWDVAAAFGTNKYDAATEYANKLIADGFVVRTKTFNGPITRG